MVRLGQRLYNERKNRGLSLEEVASATKIRSEFLSAIEKGEYNRLPSSAYAQGFVINYATYLGFPRKEATALFRREFDARNSYKVLPEGFANQERYQRRTFRIRHTAIALVLIFIVLIGYLVFQYRSVFISPNLSVDQPKENATVPQDLNVTGRTDPTAVVSVDGDIVSVNQDGTFRKSINVLPGKTQIEIIAKNRYGKATTIERDVNVKGSQ